MILHFSNYFVQELKPMYTLLTEKFGRRAANVLMVLWYTGLLLLVLYFSGKPAGLFRYAQW